MKKIPSWTHLILLVISVAPAMATDSLTARSVRENAPKGISETFFSCINKSGFDQDQLHDCLSEERKQQDQRLNKAYRNIMKYADERTKASVTAAERSWIDFNNKSTIAESALAETTQTASLDVRQAELFRYCEQANTLERYLFLMGH